MSMSDYGLQGMIDRHDLVATLDRVVGKAVTIISARADSGKTSLLHAWAGRARTARSPSCPYGRASAAPQLF